ncbi:MAG: Gfo/Idh/MocA family protein [Maioricimonas sp. JB049]
MSNTSRRDFLKHSSVAAAGAGVLASVSSRAFADSDDTIRIGLVGCGGRGTGAAVQALKTAGNVKLIAMGDAFADQLENSLNNIERQTRKDDTAHVAVDDDHKFVGFDAYRKVIGSDIDLVILATPPGFRPLHFEHAVANGKHVFMEKPVATDAPGVRQVLEAARVAKEKNLKVGVGLQRHHQPCYLDLVERVKNGEIGDVLAMRVYWNGGGVWEPRRTRDEVASEMEYQMRSWYYYNWLCGDHICEQHIHNLDVGNWILGGYPVKANGMGGRQVRTDKRYGEIFDHHAVEYTFADGRTMISQCRHIRGCWNSVSEHGHGTKGMVHLSSNPRSCRIEYANGDVYQFKGDTKTPYQIEHDELFAAIREGRSFNEAVNGAMSTMTSILGRMCTYSGKELTMDEALNKGRRVVPPNVADLTFESTPPVVPNEEGEYPIPMPGSTNVLEA